MREVFMKIIWLLAAIMKGVILLGLFLIKAALGILNLIFLLLGLFVRLFLIFFKAGIPK